ncbi:hypothetical protein BT93_K0389 [Corymbia citriodora subsp. variegata]|nr:hypothetical protein BT93_K0389 [Corymbia citriodora subsp. variegata]
MVPSEFLEVPAWPFFEVVTNPVGHFMEPCPNPEFNIGGHEFFSPFTNAEDSSRCLSSSYLPSEFLPNLGEIHYSKNSELDPTVAILVDIEAFEPILSCNDKGWTPSPNPSLYSEITNDLSLVQASLVLPFEGMKVDNKLGLPHLLKACGEAMENEQSELLDVISGCIGERANPLGNSMDRLTFYMFNRKQDLSYIKQEAFKNFEAASYAIYQMTPHRRFAHFAANSTILEFLPKHIKAVHVIDFDMGEAFQYWALIKSMVMARRRVALRITSTKWDNEVGFIEFEKAKKMLQEQAKAPGVELVVEEMRIDALVSEMDRLSKRGGYDNGMRSQWMVFNVIKGLPHMGRRRSERLVGEFLRLAKEVIANPAIGGIITSGRGETSCELQNCSGFGEFFDKNMKEGLDVPLGSCCVDGWGISPASLREAMELISGKRSYSVAIGENEHEMVLEWKDSHMPLVRFSAWGNPSICESTV